LNVSENRMDQVRYTEFQTLPAQAASTQWRGITDQLRPKTPKLANLME